MATGCYQREPEPRVDSLTCGRARALPLVLFVVFATIASACGGLPQLSDYRQRSIPLAQTSFLYASDGSLITELHAGVDRVVLSRAQMPQTIRDAVVAIEDKRFYYHHGFDLRAIVRAAYADVAAGPDRGGWLHHHAAAREAAVRGRRRDPAAEDRRGGARLAARGPAHQGPDPHEVPQHGVLRTGGVRHPGGRALVLRRWTRRTSPSPNPRCSPG